MTPQIVAVVAMDKQRGIGKDGNLPWQKIALDFKRFKSLSIGKPTIMGHKTFQSVLDYSGKPLVDRTNIVLTSQIQNLKNYENVVWVDSIDKALEKGREIAQKTQATEICIAGGAQVYNQTLKFVDKLYLTIIDQIFDCDTFFPEYKDKFEVFEKSELLEQNGYKFQFFDLKKS